MPAWYFSCHQIALVLRSWKKKGKRKKLQKLKKGKEGKIEKMQKEKTYEKREKRKEKKRRKKKSSNSSSSSFSFFSRSCAHCFFSWPPSHSLFLAPSRAFAAASFGAADFRSLFAVTPIVTCSAAVPALDVAPAVLAFHLRIDHGAATVRWHRSQDLNQRASLSLSCLSSG